MSLVALDNLVRIGQLKAEPRNVVEVNRLLAMAQTRLADAHLSHLSREGRFTSAYNAAHAAGIVGAALAWLPQRKSIRRFPEPCTYVRLVIRTVARAGRRAPKEKFG